MIEKRLFGRTGHQSTVTLFGAAALARPPGGRWTARWKCGSATASTTSPPPRGTGTPSCASGVDGAPSEGFFLATKTDRAGT